jgi:hypothetical protein
MLTLHRFFFLEKYVVEYLYAFWFKKVGGVFERVGC